MPNHTDTADMPGQDSSGAATTASETRLDRIANDAASQAAKTEQRYDMEHDIFTK
jgi:hypothetical protein